MNEVSSLPSQLKILKTLRQKPQTLIKDINRSGQVRYTHWGNKKAQEIKFMKKKTLSRNRELSFSSEETIKTWQFNYYS